MLRLILTLALAFFALPASAQSDSRCTSAGVVKLDGECWISIAAAARGAAVWGIWTGSQSQALGDDLTGDAPNYIFKRNWSEVPSSTNVGDITDYFDRLYQTPANRRIKWDWAYLLAAMNARDDDSDDRLNLIRFLRQNDAVPTVGRLLGAKSADTITIEFKKTSFDIHLAGVSLQGLSEAQKSKAVSFINGLKKSSYYVNCEKPIDTIVLLKFDYSLFHGDNRLSATALIRAETICTPSGPIPVYQLANDSSALNLNRKMVERGLVKWDRYEDPKWPKEASMTRNFWELSEGQAKARTLYVYGDKTDSEIELISAAAR